MMRLSMALGDLGTQIADAFGNAIRELFAFIPVLIGALIILLVGWIVARVVSAVVVRILRAIHFDQLMERAGLTAVLARGGVRMDPAGLLAGIVFWFVFLIFVLAAAKALGVEAITAIVTSVVLFLPNLLVALLILIVGALLARFVGDLVRSSMDGAGIQGGGIIASVARYAILAFAAILALGQLGIGAGIIQTLFASVMFGLALALALAFGLGGRETARDIVESWYASVSGRRPSTPHTVDTNLPAPQRMPPSP
ncbi:MAG TPA: hypothetical protein VGP82_11095 [Ktedonobacterales bacterium]|nr:hypothetical protein [Ktedonobacterales bacterium]